MSDAPTPPLPQRFTLAMERLIQIVGEAGARSPWIPIAVLFVIVHRLRRMGARFAALAVAAPAAPVAPVAAAGPVRAQPPRVRPPRVRGPRAPRGPKMLSVGYPDVLPRWLVVRRGWLSRLAPMAGQIGGHLIYLLHDEEMQALAHASPPVARMLRQLCFMLGVEPYRLPAPAKRKRKPKPLPAEPTKRQVLAEVYRQHVPTVGRPRAAPQGVPKGVPKGRTILGW